MIVDDVGQSNNDSMSMVFSPPTVSFRIHSRKRYVPVDLISVVDVVEFHANNLDTIPMTLFVSGSRFERNNNENNKENGTKQKKQTSENV